MKGWLAVIICFLKQVKTGKNTKNFDFIKRFGILYDLLINLLHEKISSLNPAKEQNEMINKIEKLKDFTLLEEKVITNNNAL